VKIVKSDILSLVIIGHPGLSDDEGEFRVLSSVCGSGTSLLRAFATARALNRG
jgi:hypothetical protein